MDNQQQGNTSEPSVDGTSTTAAAAAAAAVVHTFRADLLHAPESAIQRLRDGVRTCDDFIALLRERVVIEETYARSLATLSRTVPLGSNRNRGRKVSFRWLHLNLFSLDVGHC